LRKLKLTCFENPRERECVNLTQNRTEEICTATFFFLAQNQSGQRKEGKGEKGEGDSDDCNN